MRSWRAWASVPAGPKALVAESSPPAVNVILGTSVSAMTRIVLRRRAIHLTSLRVPLSSALWSAGQVSNGPVAWLRLSGCAADFADGPAGHPL